MSPEAKEQEWTDEQLDWLADWLWAEVNKTERDARIVQAHDAITFLRSRCSLLESERDAIGGRLRSYVENAIEDEAELDELRTKYQEARRDSERLDRLEEWLKGAGPNSHYVEAWRDDAGDIWLFAMGDIPDSYGPVTIAEKPTIREAIDAAATPEGKEEKE